MAIRLQERKGKKPPSKNGLLLEALTALKVSINVSINLQVATGAPLKYSCFLFGRWPAS